MNLKIIKNIKNVNLKIFMKYGNIYERQVKFIIQGQRIYDYFDFDWYLPFWDGEVIRFWSEMPIELRKNQYLYKDYLRKWKFCRSF